MPPSRSSKKRCNSSPIWRAADFFLAMIQKADGDYDGALAICARPRANIRATAWCSNQIGRILFLERQYAEAVDGARAASAMSIRKTCRRTTI